MLKVFFVPWILLHSFVVVYAVKHDLAKAVKVGQSRHLVVEEFGHQVPSFSCVVDLLGSATGHLPVYHDECARKKITYHGPPFYTVLYHQAARHWCRNLGHMVTIVLLAHTRSSVPADSQAEELGAGVARRRRRDCAVFGHAAQV